MNNQTNPKKINSKKYLATLELDTLPIQLTEKLSSRLTAALAIDIRNPLTSINLAVELLQSTINIEEKKMCMDILIRNNRRIIDMVMNFTEINEPVERSFNSGQAASS